MSSRLASRIGIVLLLVCAAGALLAAAAAVQSVVSASEATCQVEVWRLFGVLMFAGVFALLALRPSGYGGTAAYGPSPPAARAASALRGRPQAVWLTCR